MKELLIKSIESNGWEDMGPQKSETMLSFKRGHFRMNVYLTTGTVTIQDLDKRMDKGIRGNIFDSDIFK
jgi:hypothetical protein